MGSLSHHSIRKAQTDLVGTNRRQNIDYDIVVEGLRTSL